VPDCFDELRTKLHSRVTGQFADKLTRGQSSRGLVNLRTSQLADCRFFFKSRKDYTIFVHQTST